MKLLALRLLLILTVLGISACASNDDDEFANSTEEYLYSEGARALRVSNWQRAISIFQELEAQFPFGQYAAQSQIELVYAYYMSGDADAARAAADRFIRLHPDNPNIDYAYYMKGMSYYTEDERMFARYLPTDPSKRDPGQARESFSDFAQLITRFPSSPYAADARARMIYLRNLLAAYEIHVAEFYIERQAFLSSLNRARYVVENFQGTPSVPRALEIMTEMYLRLGLNDLADSTMDILRMNYPDSEAFDQQGEFIVSTQITDPSFLYSVTFGLLGSNKRDTELAPSKRPPRAGEQISQDALPEMEQRDRSWLNILSLGLLGDDGDTETDPTDPAGTPPPAQTPGTAPPQTGPGTTPPAGAPGSTIPPQPMGAPGSTL